MDGRFYLYRLFHDDETLYIGKGSGHRLSQQKRHFKLEGEIICRFDREQDAFNEEKRLILESQPRLNKHEGGQGGRCGVQRLPVELPNVFTEEGFAAGAFQVARLLAIWNRDTSLNGLLGIVGNFIDAHGLDKASNAIVPHLRRFLLNDLALENSK